VPPKPSYEPSAQDIIQGAMPSARTVVGTAHALRQRVSWPASFRATGLGRLEGGEIVLVPQKRVGEVVQRARELLSLGVALLVLPGELSEAETADLADSGPPAVVVPAETDLTTLREDLERYITRRRRELFAWDGELHRALFDAAIAGAGVGDLIDATARLAGATAVLDRGGELEVRPRGESVPADVLARIRSVATAPVGGRMLVERAPYVLASPVIAGSDVRGVVALIGVDAAMLDEHESTVATAASACAIALSREPVALLPSLNELLADPPDGLLTGHAWTAAVFRCPAPYILGFRRALQAEMAARRAQIALALLAAAPVAVATVDELFPWESVVAAVASRIGSVEVRAGISRVHHDDADVLEAVRQAGEAVSRGPGPVTRFESVELEALLGSLQGVESFVRSRLRPLLDGSALNRELLQTLAAYLSTGRNAKEAAVVLAVHRNTLIYRLHRITDLLQIDWKDADAIFALDLALRLLERGAIAREGSGPRSG
jgi:hypothetical protein